jgi:hypothetical protein
MKKGKKKFWFCPKCNLMPDVIVEQYQNVEETRAWNGFDYELQETTLTEDKQRTVCARCQTEVVEK